MNHYPHLTVAVICQRDNHILMVNEIDNGISCWNQPAGHVEVGEDLVDAAIREAQEETQFKVKPTGIVGIYQGLHVPSGTHYVRVCFTADIIERVPCQMRDSDIIDVQWLDRQSLLAGNFTLRSQLTHQCLEDFISMPNYPLSIIKSFSHRSFS